MKEGEFGVVHKDNFEQQHVGRKTNFNLEGRSAEVQDLASRGSRGYPCSTRIATSTSCTSLTRSILHDTSSAYFLTRNKAAH
jgi:hypothetical protein